MLEHHRFLVTFSPLLVVVSQLATFSPVWAAAPASVAGGANSCSKPGNLSELAAEVGGYRDLVNQISSCLTPELVKKYEVYQPNLYLDGDVLAHRVTAQVLAHKAPREKKLEVESLLSLGFSLFEGTQISYPASEQHRDELRKWLEAQKEGTLTPDALFKHALDGAGGNVQRALICCWNQLSDGWNSAAIERNSRFTTLKLKDITGELMRFDGIHQKTHAGESHEFVRGDNFSAWYHFFGTALHAYTAERSRVPRLPTTALIKLEESVVTAVKYDVKDSRKRLNLDLAGASFGKSLASDLEKFGTSSQFEVSPEATRSRSEYLVQRPDLYGESWALKPGQHPRDFGTQARTLLGQTAMQKVLLLHRLKYEYPDRFYCYANELISDHHLPEVARAALYSLAEIRTRPRAIAVLREAARSDVKVLSRLAKAILDPKIRTDDLLPRQQSTGAYFKDVLNDGDGGSSDPD